MRHYPLALLAAVTACCLAPWPGAIRAAEEAASDAPAWVVDHRYVPPWWQTSICLPDDWQKTLVGKEGQLLYDFRGKYSGFKTRIAFALEPETEAGQSEAAPTEWVQQELVSPRVPIVRTVKRRGPVEIIEEAMAVAPVAARPGRDGRRAIGRQAGPGQLGRAQGRVRSGLPKHRRRLPPVGPLSVPCVRAGAVHGRLRPV